MRPSSLSMLRTWPKMASGEYLVSARLEYFSRRHLSLLSAQQCMCTNAVMNCSQWDHGRRASLAHDRRADGDGGGLDEAEAPHSDHHHTGGRVRSQISPEAGKKGTRGIIWEP